MSAISSGFIRKPIRSPEREPNRMSATPLPHTSHEPMQVQKQITLPFSKAWEISLRSIKIRLARSLITASGILLGVAFYSSVRASSLFPVEGVGREIDAAANRQQWLAVMALIVCFF